MKKVELQIEETLKYTRGVIVELPDDMTEDQLHKALDTAERKSNSVDELIYALRPFSIEQKEAYDNSLDSPDQQEVEVNDFEWIIKSKAAE